MEKIKIIEHFIINKVWINQNGHFDIVDNNPFKEELIKILKLENISYYEINEDLIEISLNNNSILIFSSLLGISKLFYLKELYKLNYKEIFIMDYRNCCTTSTKIIYSLDIGKLEKRFPLNQEEIEKFFYDIRQVTDNYHIADICLDDIYYDTITNSYLIINISYIIIKFSKIEIRLANLFKNENIYYYKNKPITLEEIQFLTKSGGQL